MKILVIDSGIGISEQVKKDLFKPYGKGTYTNNFLGSGLGLNISSQIVETMGSKLEYESSQKGTLFWFKLPISELNFIKNESSKEDDKATKKISLFVAEEDLNEIKCV